MRYTLKNFLLLLTIYILGYLLIACLELSHINYMDSIISMSLPITLKKSQKVLFKSNKEFKHEFKNKIYTINEFDNSMKQLKTLLLDLIQDINLTKGLQIAILTQLSYGTGEFITLGKRYPIRINSSNLTNEKDITAYAEVLNTQFKFMDNWYQDLTFDRIVFNYTLISEDEYNRMSQKEISNMKDILKESTLNTEVLMNLPLNQLYEAWGSKITVSDGTSYKIEGFGQHDYYLIITNNLDNVNITTISIFTNSGELIRTFIDRKINNTQFIRYTDGKVIYIKNGQAYFYYQNKFSQMKYISKLSPMKNINLNFMTLDIETYLDANNEMQLYCICFYDGDLVKSFYLTDYFNLDNLIKDVFNELLRRKYASKSIYIHNASNFDLIFLLKHLVNLTNVKVKPLVRENKYINITIEFGDKGQYNLYIKDSLLLLPVSLAKLAKSFNTNQQKLEFNHELVKQNNLLKIKEDVIKYCSADCIALYQVLISFNKEIYDLFKINITETPTLPSLAFRIFRTNFLDKIKIPVLKGQIFKDISKSYYGGHVDMYIPISELGDTVYQYDVNGLYPNAMLSNAYPTKLISYFIGDISNLYDYKHISPLTNDSYTGFFKVKVKAPSLIHPILPFKVDNTTVYGEGSWTAWYSTEEIKNAIKFGYTFEVLAGYIFKKEELFTKYITELNNIKTSVEKGSPKYTIAKLLMNSLYGRFGMSPNINSHLIINSNELDSLINSKGIENILETIDLDNKLLISVHEDFMNSSNINVSIASSVAANGRVNMSIYKNNPDLTGTLFYTDTDSIFCNKSLPEYLISNKQLGLMKLENKYSRFISLGPKVYGGKIIDGKEVIKVKGLKSDIKLNLMDLQIRLIDNFEERLLHNKKFKNLLKGTILIKEVKYLLKPTDNKRQLTFDEGGILIETKNKIITE